MWRDLVRRLAARRGPAGRQVGAPAEVDLWDSVGRLPRPSSDLLNRIERTALDVYARNGLPTAHGHYRRGRRARSWTFLGEDLTPEDRWALLGERPPENGWRYGTLADIGRSGGPDAKAAAALLADCARLRTALTGAASVDMLETIEAAVRLGADWRMLESGRHQVGNAPLRLTAPDDAPAAARPDKSPRRKTTRAG